jgi:hypothetical protein
MQNWRWSLADRRPRNPPSPASIRARKSTRRIALALCRHIGIAARDGIGQSRGMGDHYPSWRQILAASCLIILLTMIV